MHQGEYSFAELCLPLRDEILNYVTRLAHNCREVAEDVVQEVFERAFKSWDRFVPDAGGELDAKVRGWLYRIALNVFINEFNRGKQRASTLELYCRVGVDIDHTEPAEIPQDAFPIDVGRALGRLDQRFRDVVELSYLRGLSNDEIAGRLEISPGTVRSRMARAFSELRHTLARVAQDEYGIDVSLVAEHPDAVEAPEVVQSDSHGVDCVMRGLYGGGLLVGQPPAHAVAAL